MPITAVIGEQERDGPFIWNAIETMLYEAAAAGQNDADGTEAGCFSRARAVLGTVWRRGERAG